MKRNKIRFKKISKKKQVPLTEKIKTTVGILALLLLLYMVWSVKNTEAHKSMPRLLEGSHVNIVKNTTEIEPKEESKEIVPEEVEKPQEQANLANQETRELTVEEIIYAAADKYGVSRQEMYCLAYAESGLNPNATGYNTDAVQSIDRGLYQINQYWHPDVSDAQAYNAEFAADWTAQRLAIGGHSAWYGFQSPKYSECASR
jgi:hypothetical protein